jgi:hypothetical protein
MVEQFRLKDYAKHFAPDLNVEVQVKLLILSLLAKLADEKIKIRAKTRSFRDIPEVTESSTDRRAQVKNQTIE